MVTRYEYYNTGDDDYWELDGVYWQAQTFTVGTVGHKISSVKLKLYRVGSPGTVTVSIKATTSGHPSGDDLTVGTIDGNTLTTDPAGAWYEITVTEYTSSKNTKYAVVVRALTGDASNTVEWRADSSSPTYTDGNVEYSGNSGGTWTSNTDSDFMFEVWGPDLVVHTKTVSEILGLVDDWDKNRCKKCKPSITVVF